MKRLFFAAGLALFCAAPAPAQTNLVILTGSTSGVYYPLAVMPGAGAFRFLGGKS